VYAQGKKDEDIAFEINFQDYLREHEIPIPSLIGSKVKSEMPYALSMVVSTSLFRLI
jgi:hypothetical protein